MNILNAGKIDIKPTSYSMIINSGDTEDGLLDFRLKVTRQTIGRFLGVLPLLIPEARRSFQRVSFWLDFPVDIGYMTKLDTMDLSAKRIYFKATDDELLCYVPGYNKAITTSVTSFVESINELHSTILGKTLESIKGTLAGSVVNKKPDTFRAIGVFTPNSFAGHVMAAYDANTCVVSNYIFNENTKVLERFNHPKYINYFRNSEEHGWDMAATVPFLSADLVKASSVFCTY